jgi:ribosomal protein L37AE/L43A
MPPGHPEVDGISGKIRWEFGCEFQRSVHALMEQRWRAMICPTCGKFFVADKPAQKLCSIPCYGEAKRKHALDRWNLKGNAERKARTRRARLPGSKRPRAS